MAQSDAISEQIRRLKSRGVTIMLDDFGLDSSRLKLLSRSTLDAVKLDRTLVDGVISPGDHDIVFEADGLPAGTYYVRMQSGSFQQVRAMQLVK